MIDDSLVPGLIDGNGTIAVMRAHMVFAFESFPTHCGAGQSFPENAADFSSVDKGDVSPSFLMYRLVSELECSLASQPHSLTRRGSGRLGTQSLSPRNVCYTPLIWGGVVP